MTEKLKLTVVQKLVKQINNNEFLETGDIFVKSNKDSESIEKLPALYSIYYKEIKGASVVIANQSLRACYSFLQGYLTCKQHAIENMKDKGE